MADPTNLHAAAGAADSKQETIPAAAAAAAASASDADPSGLVAYPQWDGTALGLPKGFILYSYNRLKGSEHTHRLPSRV